MAQGRDCDQILIGDVAAKDRTSLAKLYDRHAGPMLALAHRFLHNRGDAEDLVHDVFIEVWHKAGDYKAQRSSVRSWLLLRLRSRAIDRLRSLEVARKHAMVAAHLPVKDSPTLAQQVDSDRMKQSLGILNEAQRTIIELCYFQGLTCREAASHCKIPIGTVKSRLSAALARLRTELTPAMGD